MKKYVVFTSNNARVFNNPPKELEKAILELPEFLINPDFSGVKRFPPHLWRVDNGKIKSLHPSEWAAREKDLIENGVCNDVFLGKKRSKIRRLKYKARQHASKAAVMAVFIILTGLMVYLIK